MIRYYIVVVAFVILSGFANFFLIFVNSKNRLLIKKRQWFFIFITICIFFISIFLQLDLLNKNNNRSTHVFNHIYIALNFLLTAMQGLIFIGLNKYVSYRANNNIETEKEVLKDTGFLIPLKQNDILNMVNNSSENTDGAIVFYDVKEKIIIASSDIEIICGYTKEEIQNLEISSFFAKNAIEIFDKFVENNSKTIDINTIVDFKRKNGEFILMSVIGALIVKSNEKIVKCVVRDITDRIGIKTEVLKTNILIKDMLTGLETFGFCVIDLSYRYIMMNNKHQNYIKDNFNMLVKVGISFLDVINECLNNCITYERQAIVKNNIDKALSGECFTSIIEFENKGVKEYLKTELGPIKDENGKVIAVALINLCITEEEKRKVQLIQAKEKEEIANKAKSKFLANMSHEIRTPMNGIISLTDLLIQTELNEEQSLFMNVIKESATSLLYIINDILDLSKIESGKFNIKERKFNIYDLINSLAKMFLINSFKEKFVIKYEVDDDIPEFVIGDSLRLKQILVNLIGNAIKFTQQGEIFVKVGAEQIFNQGLHVLLKFEVRDTGIGISEENLMNIFESFTQSDNDYTRKYSGTGLGLSIAKQLVEAMNGNIYVESKVGVGSVFTFYIPFLISEDNMEYKKEEANCQCYNIQSIFKCNLRILVAEDNDVNRLVINKFLEQKKWCVKIVENGQEAIESLEKENFDLILMDISMPVMDGLEATKIIKNNPKYKHIPIIALTAHALTEDREKFISQGVDDYLAKPINKFKLYEIIAKSVKEKAFITKEIKENISFQVSGKSKEFNYMKGFYKLEKDLSGDAELIVELGYKIIDMFSQSEIEELINLIQKKEVETFKNQIHKLKGAILNFELHELYELLKKLSMCMESADEISISDIKNEIRNEIEEFEHGLIKYKNKKNVI